MNRIVKSVPKISMIKVLSKEDMFVVESLAAGIWREHYTPMIGAAQVDYMIKKFQSREAISHQIEKEGYRYYLIKNCDGDWVGYVGLILRDDEIFLSKLYVDSKERGRGYGRGAMEFIEKIARESGLSRITLTVNKGNKNSIGAYKKFGFVVAEDIVTDIGEGFVMDDYRMEKVVS